MGSNLCGEWKGEESEIDVESDGGKLNINTASVDELVESDHLGRAMAARLACHRDQFGPFERPEDLRQVPGIQKKMVKKLGREMSFDGARASWTCGLVSLPRQMQKELPLPVEVGRLRRLLRLPLRKRSDRGGNLLSR